MPTCKHDPALYRELCIPFPTKDSAQAAMEAFWHDLYDLRVKHRIADVLVSMAVDYVQADKSESEVQIVGHMGSASNKMEMAMRTFKWAIQERHAETINFITLISQSAKELLKPQATE